MKYKRQHSMANGRNGVSSNGVFGGGIIGSYRNSGMAAT